MARLDVSGLDDFLLDMEELSDLPDKLIDEMLLAEAEVSERAQKAKGKAYGVEDTGMTLSSIGHGKIKKRKSGKVLYVGPSGKNRKGNRNAEVAFINEFGKNGQAARPFIRDANESAADEICGAAEKIYNEYLNSKNL